MNGFVRQTLLRDLSDKEFRDAYAADHVETGVAYQIRALREQRGWSQVELARRAGKTQSAISRLEDPDYGRLNLQTLLQLASVFDVALLVRFVAFSELVRQTSDLSPNALAVLEFSRDRQNIEEALLRPTPSGESIEDALQNESRLRATQESADAALLSPPAAQNPWGGVQHTWPEPAGGRPFFQNQEDDRSPRYQALVA